MKQIDFQSLSEGRLHSSKKCLSFIPKELKNCSHVWVRVDRIRKPLEAPYSGPYKVLQLHDKTVTIETTPGNSQVVSIERVKPALLQPLHHLLPASAPQQPNSALVSNPTQSENPRHPQQQPSSPAQPSLQQQQHGVVTRSGRRVHFAC